MRIWRLSDDVSGVGDSESESRSATGFGFDPDSSSILFNDSLTDSQADACAGVFGTGVQTLEEAKNYLLVFWGNSDAIVTYSKLALVACTFPRDMNRGLFVRGAILDRVTD
jgi:hypothetical protein